MRPSEKKGIEIGKVEVVLKILQSGKLTVREIASLTGISEAVARKVEKTMQAG